MRNKGKNKEYLPFFVPIGTLSTDGLAPVSFLLAFRTQYTRAISARSTSNEPSTMPIIGPMARPLFSSSESDDWLSGLEGGRTSGGE